MITANTKNVIRLAKETYLVIKVIIIQIKRQIKNHHKDIASKDPPVVAIALPPLNLKYSGKI